MTGKTPLASSLAQDNHDESTRLFYDALNLKKVLNLSPKTAPTLKTDWHRCLDYLSWLCDFRRGGVTVTSIAAEQTEKGPKFWIVANTESTTTASSHLEEVLTELASLRGASQSGVMQAEDEIFVRSVHLSRQRVHDYCHKLSRCLESAESEVDNSEDSGLLSHIKAMLSSDLYHHQRCKLLYNLRHSPIGRQLSFKATSGPPQGPWYFVRHYVGRLGSWSKASKLLVAVALSDHHIFEDFQIGSVNSAASITMPIFDENTGLQSALSRVLPQYNGDHLQRAVQKMQDTLDIDMAATFIENYSSPKFVPIVHAEVRMVEHFYFNRLDFFRDDCYIGCTRPCHGNVWIKWCLPLRLDEENEDKRKHAGKIWKKIIEYMKRDLGHQILSTVARSSYALDSTTAMSVPSLLA